MNDAEEAWKKQHVAGAWSMDSSQLASELEPTQTTQESESRSEVQRNDGFLPTYTQGSAYIAVRSASPPPAQRGDSPTLPLLVLPHNRSVSMPPPRPARPDDMISPITPHEVSEIPNHLLYSSGSITSRGGEPYRPYSLPANPLVQIPQVHPPPEFHPLPQPPYDSPIDLWNQPPTPPPKSNRRPSRIHSINRKVSIVRKPVPIHFLLSAPKYGGLGGLGDLRRSDTGYSSHYSTNSNLGRADSGASMAGRHTWAPQSAAAYSDISASTPFDTNGGLERNLTLRGFSAAQLPNVVEKEDTIEAARCEDGAVDVPELESDTTSNEGTSDRDTLEVETKDGEEARANTPDPIPAPLRIIKKGNEIDVPMLKLPMPKSFEERREMGRIYTVR
ncbi:hypothetical protein V497_03182 [Pseudogymnoascus sp. VKM F-4516 (FW-969)]|nr:hypothetical protein V497_03182 [Pseudogymnoascus sp. VKM F-4516 (FW-969)]